MNLNEEESEAIKTGIPWGPFTLRVPFIHTGFVLPEFLQGLVVVGSTALALVPVLTSSFGLSFEEAVAMSVLHLMLMNCSWMLFGEPYCPGWVTPALPFALLFVISEEFATATERFQAMTALSLDLAALLLLLGVTGLGARLVRWVPDVLKGGIILGAALAAFLQIFDFSSSSNALVQQPYAATSALVITLMLAFSLPVQRWKTRHKSLALIASLGLLPGFLVAAAIGPLAGEFQYELEWGLVVLPFDSLWQKASPLSIGWPDVSLYLHSLPLALITYIILFGDLVTGSEIVGDAQKQRLDDVVDIDSTRSHLALGIRNALMAIIAPFFPSQGALSTGPLVVVIQAWREGPKAMASLHDGIASYYQFGLPLMFFFLPMLTAFKPLLGIALLLTLALTGFACAGVALNMAKTNLERAVMLLTAVCLTVFEPWQGLLAGVAAAVMLIGIAVDDPTSRQESGTDQAADGEQAGTQE